MLPTYANCVRDGVLHNEIPVCDIVKGDIVHVQAGDIVPADIRIIESKGFKVRITTILIKYLTRAHSA